MKINTLVIIVAYLAGFLVGLTVTDFNVVLLIVTIPFVWLLYKAVNAQTDNTEVLKTIAEQMKKQGLKNYTAVVKEEEKE